MPDRNKLSCRSCVHWLSAHSADPDDGTCWNQSAIDYRGTVSASYGCKHHEAANMTISPVAQS